MTDFWCQSLIVILHQILVTRIVQPSKSHNYGRNFWSIIRPRRGRAVCVPIHRYVFFLRNQVTMEPDNKQPNKIWLTPELVRELHEESNRDMEWMRQYLKEHPVFKYI